MQAEQFEQWKQFTEAICRHGWPDITDERKARLLDDAIDFIELFRDEPVDGWDNDYCLCDSFRSHFYEYYATIWIEKLEEYKDDPHYFVNMLCSVIRAGIGFVTNDRGGVLGFCVDDLRRMFSDGIPKWVLARYDGKLMSETPGETAVWF